MPWIRNFNHKKLSYSKFSITVQVLVRFICLVASCRAIIEVIAPSSLHANFLDFTIIMANKFEQLSDSNQISRPSENIKAAESVGCCERP